ncbi:hypothetical protein PG22506_1224 [Bifidobacterium pseudolongum subsp. globosum]|nr:hypothetical protein PG22506_1224 [Bifidobacterium pseudolongum subsp. globosum]
MRGKRRHVVEAVAEDRIIPAHAGQTFYLFSLSLATTDHPRACGANRMEHSITHYWNGSSPRMRGKPVRLFCVPVIGTDHPRACGANTTRINPASHSSGSSPRMRGKRRLCCVASDWRRIIPAHAGQTPLYSSMSSGTSDHPRACGANSPRPLRTARCVGSSPRMRGKRTKIFDYSGNRRIIPAHAGQTQSAHTSLSTCADHPRACGANKVRFAGSIETAGSSPRMRGKQAQAHELPRSSRIIPAHAGQTASRSHARTLATDHPRACGANEPWSREHTHQVGSSPRMRGKRRLPGYAGALDRIIPAHAGQTHVRLLSSVTCPDHPRACGANAARRIISRTSGGSSPRMRGKRVRGVDVGGARRIIPAHAGQTLVFDTANEADADHPRACGANARSPI